MNDHLATAAELVPPTAPAAQLPPHADHAPITGWHALQGLSIGVLRGLSPGTDADVVVEQVHEEAADLAVADRVAWVLAGKTGRQHVVLTSSTGYLVATLAPELDWAAAMRMEPLQHAPSIVSVATADGVLPILLPVAATPA